MKKRLFILALDGVPYSFLKRTMDSGLLPNLKNLCAQARFSPLDSVLPPVSSSAWASFMTGQPPEQHGIWGFTERDPQTMDWFIPNSSHLRGTSLFEQLSRKGKRVFVMNVPLTYPPRPVNGISICGFLGSDITRGTYPPEIGTMLKARDYVIDADTELAKTDLLKFYHHLNSVMDRRIEMMWHFYNQESWDFFMTHIMETDRLHHFFWEFMENGHEVYAPLFYDLYRKLDQLIGRIVEQLDDNQALMLLSDHGFTTLRTEVYLNQWLQQKGYLRYSRQAPQSLQDMHPQSLAYSLYPGRIYINLRGREKSGSVPPGQAYEQLCERLQEDLLQLTDHAGRPVIAGVRRPMPVERTTAVLSGQAQMAATSPAPDMIAVPYKGYDLKGNLSHPALFSKTWFNGTHTQDDAFVLCRGIGLPEQHAAITDLAPAIMKFYSNRGHPSSRNN